MLKHIATRGGQDSPESTAPDVATAPVCLSGAFTTPTAPDDPGVQTSRAQRGALAPGWIVGRKVFETVLLRALAIKNYHRPSSGVRHSVRRRWGGDRWTDRRGQQLGAIAVLQVGQLSCKGILYCVCIIIYNKIIVFSDSTIQTTVERFHVSPVFAITIRHAPSTTLPPRTSSSSTSHHPGAWSLRACLRVWSGLAACRAPRSRGP